MNRKRLSESLESTLEDPYAIFVFTMNAARTREKYITRLDSFISYMSKAIPYKNVADTLLKLPRKITTPTAKDSKYECCCSGTNQSVIS